MVLLVLLTVTISETFRLPEAALSAYVVLFVSRSERASTIKTALGAGIAAVGAIFIAILVFMASLSEPALRVPLIACVTFAAMVFARASPLGPLGFAAGFIIAYGLTLGDEVLGLSLQSGAVSNVVGPGAPQLLFLPPEEALLHFLLWLALAIALPVGLVVVANLLTGRHPVRLLCAGLATRLAACAGFCAGEPGADPALAGSAREGTAGLLALLKLSAVQRPDFATLIRETEQLALTLLAWQRIAPEERRRALAPCTEGLRAAEQCLRDGAAAAIDAAAPLATSSATRPLATEVTRALVAIRHALVAPAAPQTHHQAERGRLISADALRDPDTVRFALKVTLAVMLCYGAQSLLDWPEIHTCVVTCFFVSLGTIGESLHKATLRVIGALIGGALGIGTILLVMPCMVDLSDLLLALGVVTFIAGWIACGSARISYAGWQIGLAYYLTILQGFGPTLDMQTARDRVIGIVLGNAVVFLVFTTLWPASLAQSVRGQVTIAISQLAKLMRLGAGADTAGRLELQKRFGAALITARSLMADLPFERAVGAQGQIDTGAVSALEYLMVVVTVILTLRSDPAWQALPDMAQRSVQAYHAALADWFDRCADWVRAGIGGDGLQATIPSPPDLQNAPDCAAWYGALDADLRGIMDQVMRRASPVGVAVHD